MEVVSLITLKLCDFICIQIVPEANSTLGHVLILHIYVVKLLFVEPCYCVKVRHFGNHLHL